MPAKNAYLEVQTYDLPDEGEYRAKVEDVTDFESGFGPGYKIVFRISDPEGEYDGNLVDAIASAKTGKNAKIRTWFEAITGRSLESGERFNVNDLIAARCRIVIGHTQKDDGGVFAKVEKVMAPAAAKKKAAPPPQPEPEVEPPYADDDDEFENT